ncbi:glycosyltransferase family protein [Sphingomonas daechungensis]|uniref:glycosyltransferase family protein n=1 Tax=Sphingomonas daechungensis TaxID=1176646 RepID=UPI0031F09C3F
MNILRPLIYMASRSFSLDVLILVSTKFTGRDIFGIWQRELAQTQSETSARVEYFNSDWEAYRHLSGEGLIFAASESYLHNHVTTHSVFRYAPPSYLKVTLQHGFECVGFRHSADHVRAHGATASFGADIVCAWQPSEHLVSMSASQRSKLLVTGPTSVLQLHSAEVARDPRRMGIVCENLHSVRLNGAGDFKGEFVDAFAEFCSALEEEGREVALRPHPGGQYVLKNKVPLPRNARIENAPMYRVNLRQFGYGISAPSSVLIDMLLAEIPTAVWRDQGGGMDAGNYDGLSAVSTPAEWAEFSKAAIEDPEPFVELQQRFLDRQEMPLDPQDVFQRYAKLFETARRVEIRPTAFLPERERVLFVANGNVPTLQLSFTKPLAPMVARGELASKLVTEQELGQLRTDTDARSPEIADLLDSYNPSIIIFCRYSGPGYETIVDWARKNDLPIVYHVDDDLLAIPPNIGQRKFEHHNAPERIASVRYLLTAANLVYASTEKLKHRFLEYFPDLQVVSGRIYCSGSVLRTPARGSARKVGYMASADHAHNLEMILPAIEQLLDHNPLVEFELFGSIPVPLSLERFGSRVVTAPPVANYSKFLEEFAARHWDVGICPLVPIDFNLMKANTKWVEYTASGAAVVASRGTVYDECCADGCGILAATTDEWFAALDRLVNDENERLGMVQRAQNRLEQEYSVGRLREQVLGVMRLAKEAIGPQALELKEENEVCQTA